MKRKKLLKLPTIFIGSSKESIKIALLIANKLRMVAIPALWNDDVFELSKTTIENLIEQLDQCHFGIFIFHPDDKLNINGAKYKSTRDNVIFELGLFMGKLGRERCIIVLPDKIKEFRIPSDLLGIVYAKFNLKDKKIEYTEIRKIKRIIAKYGKTPLIVN